MSGSNSAKPSVSKYPGRVSVVIPTYNREAVLPRAIKSVLKQTYTDVELIVVDDGSTDDSIQAVKEFGDEINYYSFSENRGANTARNKGIAESTGEYIAFLDSDDEFPPNHVETMVSELESITRKFGGVFTRSQTFKGEELWNVSQYDGKVVTHDKIIRENVVGGFSNIMVRRSVFEEVGLLDEEMPAAQDYEFYIRLLKKYQLKYVQSTYIIRHNRSNQISSNPRKKRHAHELLLKKHGDVLTNKRIARQLSALGIVYVKKGDPDQAAGLFKESIRYNYREYRAYVLYCLCKIGVSPPKKAISFVEYIRSMYNTSIK